ncbi:5-methyltetrahydropteroyltriglutamate--homocysteine S-methyltransferase [Meiothermus ruber]|jgi:5-methyltetrahydropteroyltriglutamate--homocysteine methyltransferase|uniref:5-methyltetrahydropteroyltriglutamate-- homocysteine S-methyltransferase n=1 Tax=Meiothermus ruber TaxID=277 RepID=UPI00034D18DA|nr:5-methyltetrahydropteroyltriglutamate--homocysteine S-methyltransferase [Meiothermus ruber]MCX7801628.1 5-methyltetrahydropteroyltriglutamate--homocysteine S-methyltransferase [Meiothermus ruber]GAO74660.1 5-methyltetrahydropteroyltriglutamate/ homocysteine S-methyltransferase [Meiothermus ruber H328]
MKVGNLGFPRIGAKRELKWALEGYWQGKIDENELRSRTASLRLKHWRLQQEHGVTCPPSNDFSLYDHVLDAAWMVGAIPERFNPEPSLSNYFAMARGLKEQPPLEMTKWFDTNYHYLVPEFEAGMRYSLTDPKVLNEFKEALAQGIHTRPVLLGPVTLVWLGRHIKVEPEDVLAGILPVYVQVLDSLGELGAQWVQMDEPLLGLELSPRQVESFRQSYAYLAQHRKPHWPRCLLANYFSPLRENLGLALELGCQGLHLDLVRGAEDFEPALAEVPSGMVLSLGLVDGRNVWRTDLAKAQALLEKAQARLGIDLLEVAPSCSLLYVPYDLRLETQLDPRLKSWLAFSVQKLDELTLLAQGIPPEVRAESQRSLEERRNSPVVQNPEVRRRLAQIRPEDYQRRSPFDKRWPRQQEHLRLPTFPTTTIGSFPQTAELRLARAALREKRLSEEAYQSLLREQIAQAIDFQEEIELDVLVHGEPERSDMVEYFAEQLEGFAITQHGWVQSYGSRAVKPPIIYGDVHRSAPMTVHWIGYAQSLTSKPVKGMLTGPLTLMKWSFVRDDQPLQDTCTQIALALRDEVKDLEAAGIRVIQVDEPALREAAPLRPKDWPEYFDWAVKCFRLATSGVADATQIHSHMCYSDFNSIISYIAAMDADVISIEAARSQMELLEAFGEGRYPNHIGPGVYDIHSPRIPSVEEIIQLLKKIERYIPLEKIWVNPDCGLKTRSWAEVRVALKNMVLAAKAMRARGEQ